MLRRAGDLAVFKDPADALVSAAVIPALINLLQRRPPSLLPSGSETVKRSIFAIRRLQGLSLHAGRNLQHETSGTFLMRASR